MQTEKVNFNFLVTLSETNFAENVDEYFETISQVQGFNGSDVKSVVAKLGDSHREVVLELIQSLPKSFSDLEQRNPMLILLLSFLVSHDPSTDLGQTLSIFTVYAKTVLRLLGSVDFESQRNLVKAVGRIAFDVLQSGKVYTKAEVSDSKILVKGLLVESKTSLISFAHSSLQMFLASLYLVLELDQGLSIETLLGKKLSEASIYDKFTVLYFCLSLLGENPFVNLRNIKIVRLELKKYILGRINSAQLDVKSIAMVYPALNISMANMKNDKLSLPFFLEMLSECKNVQDLILTPCPGLPVDKILSAMKDQCKFLQSIRLLDDNDAEIHVNITNELCPDDLSVVIHNQSGQCVVELLEFLQTIERPPCIYFVGGNKSKPMIDMSLFPTNIRKLYLVSRKGDMHPRTYLTARDGFPQYDNLTHLAIPDSKLCVSDQVVEAFSEAFEKSRLSSLSNLVLGASGLSRKFSKLLKSGCPTLRVLNFQSNSYVKEDEGCWKELLPQLKSIAVDTKSSSFECPGESLTTLSCVENDNASSGSAFTPHVTYLGLPQIPSTLNDAEIYDLLNIGSLPSLTHLSIRGKGGSKTFVQKLSQNEIVRNLIHFHLSGLHAFTMSYFFHSNKGFPNLQSLALSGCIRYSQDLRILAQARNMGLLPMLEHLDLSKNVSIDDFCKLFDFECKWENLKSLNVDRERESQSHPPIQDFQCLTRQVQSGCLKNLEKLQVFVQTENFLPTDRFSWPSLRDLGISTTKPSMYKTILSCLGDTDVEGYFPVLKVITLGAYGALEDPRVQCIARDKQRLRENGLSVYFITAVDMW